MCTLNITFLQKFLYRIAIKSIKSLLLLKNLTRKTINWSYSPQISDKFRKNCLYWKMKGTLTFINRKFFIFFQYPNFKNINSLKRLCLCKNYCLLLLKTYRSNFKYNDLLHMLNVYKIPAKEHQVVDFRVADQISASEVLFWKYLAYFTLKLHNYKKLKTTKFLRFTIFSILSVQ